MSTALQPEIEPLFHTSLYPFQAEGAAKAYLRSSSLIVYSPGTGKTLLSMAVAALMLEDDKVDQVIIVAESTKVRDWVEDDFPGHSSIPAQLYAGSPEKRAKILTDPATALVMTYETMRNDICSFKPKSTAVAEDGPLFDFLQDKRVLIVYDEADRISNRGSKLYKANEHLLKSLRRRKKMPDSVKAIGLTATPIRTSPVNVFNICRLLSPKAVCTVEEFADRYISQIDDYKKPIAFKNLTSERMADPDLPSLSGMLSSVILRKRKSDPDVIEQFPAKVENPWQRVELHPKHAELIAGIREHLGEGNGDLVSEKEIYGLLRQVCNHPASLLRSKGTVAKDIARIVGEKGLLAIPNAKDEYVASWLTHLGPEQGVIFTFYGQSVLPFIADLLRDHKVDFVMNHGQMNGKDKKRYQDAFKAGDAQIFLSSDAGARGLNLGVGSGMLHYEPPETHMIYEQRSDRVHRIDSVHASITIDTLMCTSAGIITPDELCAEKIQKRQGYHEDILDADMTEEEILGSGMVTARMREMMLSAIRG